MLPHLFQNITLQPQPNSSHAKDNRASSFTQVTGTIGHEIPQLPCSPLHLQIHRQLQNIYAHNYITMGLPHLITECTDRKASYHITNFKNILISHFNIIPL